jgi:hypothetical protein
VTGEIVISGMVPALAGATAHVRLEDVGRADAGAELVAEAVIANLSHEPSRDGAGTRVPFELYAAPGAARVDPKSHYAVRVWVDSDGDGTRGRGDLDSDERYPVLTRGHGRTVTITLGPSAGS